MEQRKIKVVWICHFSDEKVRNRIHFSKFYYRNLFYLLIRGHKADWKDYAIWNSNAIREFEKYKDVELTVIFPHPGIRGEKQIFGINGINYICFRSEDDNWLSFLRKRLFHSFERNYSRNRKLIATEIANIQPDVVHIIGAENPYYSIATLDIPVDIPSVTSLQTLMSKPDFFANFPIAEDLYKYRSDLEKQIIKRSDYIASNVESTISYIKKNIKSNAIFLQMTLAVGEDINTAYNKKEYDFVYFAANISKACDDAIEAFAIAHKEAPYLTLNISGSYDDRFKINLDKRIEELGLSKYIFFTGPQPTHEAVLHQIKKSRYALLPLKVDLISGTIREAMACGLPVVSTITPATPSLNRLRESILLSEKGDYESMAFNMMRLVKCEDYAEMIRQNAIRTVSERYGNEGFMKKWRKAYSQIIENFHYGNPFSEDLLSL